MAETRLKDVVGDYTAYILQYKSNGVIDADKISFEKINGIVEILNEVESSAKKLFGTEMAEATNLYDVNKITELTETFSSLSNTLKTDLSQLQSIFEVKKTSELDKIRDKIDELRKQVENLQEQAYNIREIAFGEPVESKVENDDVEETKEEENFKPETGLEDLISDSNLFDEKIEENLEFNPMIDESDVVENPLEETVENSELTVGESMDEDVVENPLDLSEKSLEETAEESIDDEVMKNPLEEAIENSELTSDEPDLGTLKEEPIQSENSLEETEAENFSENNETIEVEKIIPISANMFEKLGDITKDIKEGIINENNRNILKDKTSESIENPLDLSSMVEPEKTPEEVSTEAPELPTDEAVSEEVAETVPASLEEDGLKEEIANFFGNVDDFFGTDELENSENSKLL